MSTFIGDISTRLKRLEDSIGSVTDELLRFMQNEENIGVTDTFEIYKRDVNDSFLLGTSKIGVSLIGDRRSEEVLLYSG